MPRKSTVERAKRDLAEGKKASTAAGEFVREEIEHVREGKHGARSTKQIIAIGLAKARRAGVPLKPPSAGTVPARIRRAAERDYRAGQGRKKPPSPRRSRAAERALQRQSTKTASHDALSRQAKRTEISRLATRRRNARA